MASMVCIKSVVSAVPLNGNKTLKVNKVRMSVQCSYAKLDLKGMVMNFSNMLVVSSRRWSINTGMMRDEKTLATLDQDMWRINREFKLLHTDVEMVNYAKHRIRQILEKHIAVNDKERGKTKKETPTIVKDKKILVITKDIDLINKFSTVYVSFCVKVKDQEEFNLFQDDISSEIYMLIASLQEIRLA